MPAQPSANTSSPVDAPSRLPLPEYDRLDATALAALVAARQVSPSELLDAAIARADARNPAINAIVRRHDAEARRQASGHLPDGPFTGVPFLLKDLLAYRKGWPITGSSRALEHFVAPFDAELVRRFERAGLVLFGQTNLPEMGLMAVTEPHLRGPCRNPWNLDHSPGGSSGGSAAAVAARIVPVAHGNDGGGSIRIPASCCALFGLKPTRGRVSLAPGSGEAWSGLVQDHVLSRSVRDSAAMLDVLAGNVPGDPYWAPPLARPLREEVTTPPGKLRIAFTTRNLFGKQPHPDNVAAVQSAARLLTDLGHELVEAEPPISAEELSWAYVVICGANLRADLDLAARLQGRPHASAADVELVTWALATVGRRLPSDALARALGSIHMAARAMATFFEQHDLLLTATTAQPPPRIGALAPGAWTRLAIRLVGLVPSRRLIERFVHEVAATSFDATGNTMLFNETGQPAMSVPLSWSSDGLPIGVQLAGRFGDEATLFRLAGQLEQARPWADRLPPLLSPPSARDGRVHS